MHPSMIHKGGCQGCYHQPESGCDSDTDPQGQPGGHHIAGKTNQDFHDGQAIGCVVGVLIGKAKGGSTQFTFGRMVHSQPGLQTILVRPANASRTFAGTKQGMTEYVCCFEGRSGMLRCFVIGQQYRTKPGSARRRKNMKDTRTTVSNKASGGNFKHKVRKPTLPPQDHDKYGIPVPPPPYFLEIVLRFLNQKKVYDSSMVVVDTDTIFFFFSFLVCESR